MTSEDQFLKIFVVNSICPAQLHRRAAPSFQNVKLAVGNYWHTSMQSSSLMIKTRYVHYGLRQQSSANRPLVLPL